jgi:hypothetical protein
MTTSSEMTSEMTMSGTPVSEGAPTAPARPRAKDIVARPVAGDQGQDGAAEPEGFEDPAGELLRRMGGRRRSPITECENAPEKGSPLGPTVSFQAVWADRVEAARDYGEVVPAVKWLTIATFLLPAAVNLLCRAGEHMTERNARFYGTLFAGGVTFLIIYLVSHFTHG